MNTNNKPLLNPANRSQIKDAIKNYIVEHIDEICEELPDVISEDVPQRHPVIVDGGVYHIVNQYSRSVISGGELEDNNGGPVILRQKIGGDKSQQWEAVKLCDRVNGFSFKNVKSKLFLDVRGAVVLNQLWQYIHNATPAQRFTVEEKKDGTFFICSRIDEEYKISVSGRNYCDGALICLRDIANESSRWLFERVG
jgi:hypothetical protein